MLTVDPMSGEGWPPLFGPFCALMASVTWTLGSAVYGKLSARYSPFAVNFGRTMVSLPLYLIAAWITAPGGFALVTWPQAGWLFASMVSSYAFADALFMMSIRSLGLPGALAIASTYPLWSALAGWLVRGEPIEGWRLVGLVMVVAGSALVILSQRRGEETRRGLDHPGVGVALGLLTSLFWAMNAFAVAQGGQGLPTATANAIRMAIAFVFCPIMGLVMTRRRTGLVLEWSVFLRTVPVFFLESFLGSFFFMYGLTHSPLAVGAALSSLSPVVAVPVSLYFGWERPSAKRILGVVAVVVGACLLVAG